MFTCLLQKEHPTTTCWASKPLRAQYIVEMHDAKRQAELGQKAGGFGGVANIHRKRREDSFLKRNN